MITTPISPLFDTKNVYALKTLLTIVIRTFRSITIKHWTILFWSIDLFTFKWLPAFIYFFFDSFIKYFLVSYQLSHFKLYLRNCVPLLFFIISAFLKFNLPWLHQFKTACHVEQNKENKFPVTSSMCLYSDGSWTTTDHSARSIHIIVYNIINIYTSSSSLDFFKNFYLLYILKYMKMFCLFLWNLLEFDL